MIDHILKGCRNTENYTFDFVKIKSESSHFNIIIIWKKKIKNYILSDKNKFYNLNGHNFNGSKVYWKSIRF